VVVTATFRLLYVFVMIEHERRRLIHVNVTANPTAQWTLQQFREAMPVDHGYRFLIHDRDAIFSNQVDQGVRPMGLRVLKTPLRTPVANAICERLIETIRRECLDFVIARNACHLFGLLKEWVTHYNEGRPHMALGPGIPQPRAPLPVSHQVHRYQIPRGQRVVTRSVLNGLHQDYGLDNQVA
jgi:putative transposase